MTLLATVYCSIADVQRYLSAQGVVSFADHDQSQSSDTDVVEDCINEASQELELYLRPKYDQVGLTTSDIVKRWCVKLSAFFLCHRRGCEPPMSLASAVEYTRVLLQQIHDCDKQLSDVPFASSQGPSHSNMTIDRRYIRSKARVTRPNSSDERSALPQHFSQEYVVDDV